MSRFSGKINAFFYKNRNKGIPNLMLYIAIGNVVVYLLYLLNMGNALFYELLRFDRALILQGQLWRLISYPLTYLMNLTPILGLLTLAFYVWGGKVLEQYWGVLRFNLYYLLGVLLTDAAALLLGCEATAGYINLSIFLAMATVMPDEMVRIYFIIPVKLKWLAWVDLGITLIGVVSGVISMIYGLTHGTGLYLAWLLPIVALLNYFLFFGRGVVNVLPEFMKHPKNRAQRKTAQSFRAATQPFYTPPAPKTQPQRQAPVREAKPYRFRCTVCGRTDVSNPNLEFRYCSKCAGYRCYCADHINQHTHVSD